jgi:hypothetical protein
MPKIRLTYSGVVATLALFVALGGGAYAIGVAKNSVTSKSIKRGQVKTSDIGPGAVTGAKVKDASLLAGDFAAGQIPPGPPGAKGAPGQDATNLFAYAGASGNLLYGDGATAVAHIGAGDYGVTFNRDLTNCVAVANSGTGQPAGSFGTAGGTTTANAFSITGSTVHVAVFSTNTATTVDRAFTVAVFC